VGEEAKQKEANRDEQDKLGKFNLNVLLEEKKLQETKTSAVVPAPKGLTSEAANPSDDSDGDSETARAKNEPDVPYDEEEKAKLADERGQQVAEIVADEADDNQAAIADAATADLDAVGGREERVQLAIEDNIAIDDDFAIEDNVAVQDDFEAEEEADGDGAIPRPIINRLHHPARSSSMSPAKVLSTQTQSNKPNFVLLIKVLDEGEHKKGNRVRKALKKKMNVDHGWGPQQGESSMLYWKRIDGEYSTDDARTLVKTLEREIKSKLNNGGSWQFTYVLLKPISEVEPRVLAQFFGMMATE
jgi:hypothetical protein